MSQRGRWCFRTVVSRQLLSFGAKVAMFPQQELRKGSACPQAQDNAGTPHCCLPSTLLALLLQSVRGPRGSAERWGEAAS